ncbi:heme biosynthesis HemY N-terminal domain-containing protein [uncultured Roseovarius sp.]|jgi:HemY protein|uniref:heme biosynthesis protein HemY n=1 Tax=uncultured Roseovarius sp. TaxID=293344 RepID=UPI00262BB898|nr:heme biosynthesis HemY N-terminal domain-containing protein [uncultured Roseovarius sp.]
MLWSIIKIAVFIALVAGVTLGASFLLELDGGVRIVMAGVEINLTPIKAVIALGVLVFAIWLLMKLTGLLVASLKFINGDETALSRYFDRSRQDKGYRALSEGMLALASGEGEVAMAQAAKAEKYLRKPALTNLITAQAAEMAGNRSKAEEVYKRLLTNEKTRFVGVRGILRQKLAEGDTETALKLAKTAFTLKPRHAEVQDTLLDLQAKTSDWKGARETLNAKLKYGNLPRDVHKRRDAVLALSEARDVLDEGKTIEAREAAIEANRLSPDLIPAAVLAARGYIDQGNTRNALRVINKAWLVHPHPNLAAAFAAIEPNETPNQRLKRFAKLLKVHPDHRETRLLAAELNLAAEDFPAARRALGNLAEVEPDARAVTIMAAIERGEGAPDAVVKGWLARALSAPRGPQWVCDKCQHIHVEWSPTCENCNSFDTLSWRAPPNSTIATPTGLEMLPLIVGALDEPHKEAAKEMDDTVVDAEIVAEEDEVKLEK